nr:hypothetical protein [Tanacetum cinerariifolium]
MGYEHLSITLETESDEVIESNAENLLPIPSKCEVTLEDEIEYDMPAKDVYPHCFNVEYDFIESLLNRDTFIDFSSKFDFSGELAHIKPEIPKSDFDLEDNPSISRPLPEPPDDNFDLEPEVISAVMEDIDEPDEHFNPG